MTTSTPVPCDKHIDASTFERRESVVRSYSRSFPKTFAKAQGSWIHAGEKGRYLDFLAGCSTLNYGHNHPVLKEALVDYIASDGIAHGLDMQTEAKEAFLEEFETTILKPRKMDHRVMFTGPTGANAVEAALKLARKVTKRTNIIAFTNGFHGMTIGALSCTGNSGKRGGAGLPLCGVTHEAYDGYFGEGVDTAEQLDRRLSDPSSGVDAPAALLIEVVQGEGGLNVASVEWLKKMAAIARKHGALLIIDDIQAGCGRTGSFFSFEDAGITPDIITMAKSLSGYGLPFAITLVRPEIDVWKPGEHNGTFRGNNHAFVTARAAIEHFWRDDAFEKSVREKGDYLGERLSAMQARFKSVAHRVKGKGMMRGIDVGTGELASRITEKCFEHGLIIETSGADDEVVKVLAPLTIEMEELKAGLDILEQSMETVVKADLSVAAE